MPEWLAEDAGQFETISRNSRIHIISPAQHSAHNSVTVKMALHEGLDLRHVKQVELLASRSGIYDGFLRVGDVDLQTLKKEFQTKKPGVWVLKARMTNARGEIAHSQPVTIYIGHPDQQKAVSVSTSSMMPGTQKNKLYGEFVKLGGGEAQKLKDSKVLAADGDEAAYRKELHGFYAEYGKTAFRDALDTDAAEIFFDGETDVAGNKLYSGADTLVQAAFSSVKRINRLDIHWKDRVPDKEIRLEIQTSVKPEAWYSFTNDDRLWQFSAGRMGGTLKKEHLPGTGSVSSIYFPEREARAVRLLLTAFPDNAVTEFRFYGN